MLLEDPPDRNTLWRRNTRPKKTPGLGKKLAAANADALLWPSPERYSLCVCTAYCFNRFDVDIPVVWQQPNKQFQPGGEKRAWHTLHNIFTERGKGYAYAISSPSKSLKACARYTNSPLGIGKKSWRRFLVDFTSRLHWHCHFIQKFESEIKMQFRAVNRAYEHYQYKDTAEALKHILAWQQGQTGFPLIDACMRSMLVSFLCHQLDVNWHKRLTHLARVFFDFEPGIHYPQFQIQAGVTGINLIRLYNPIKQSQARDPHGIFIRKWLPELSELLNELLHQPWKLTQMEQQMYAVTMGQDYPLPIIDLEKSAKTARDKLWAFQKRDDVQAQGRRIIKRHTLPSRPKTR